MSDKETTIYFYGADNPNGWLSQMFSSQFEYEGVTYSHNEQFFQAAKASYFGDQATRRAILAEADPKEQKHLGKKVVPFDKDEWNEVCVDLAVIGNYLKFTRSNNADVLRTQLLATGDKELAEASPRDRTWGIGFGAANADKNRHRWGKNLLGKVLMEVRRRLVLEEKLRRT